MSVFSKDIYMMKKCSVCKQYKNYDEFHKDKYQKDGYKNQCKNCRQKKQNRINNHKSLDYSITRSLSRALKNNKKGYIWEKVINITLDEMKKHLEKQFDEKMNWNNYGTYWVVDKIIPLSLYVYSTNIITNEFLKAWSLKNFRPYPRKLKNRKKHKFIIEDIQNYNLYDILPAGLLKDININNLINKK